MSRPKKLIRPETHIGIPFGQMKLNELAYQLKVPTDRLLPVIVGGYIKKVKDSYPHNAKHIVVERPSSALIAWLKQMLRPMAMRPLLTLKEIADILGMKETALRNLCKTDKRIKFHRDPAFGELISPRNLFFLIKRLPKNHGAPSFDRARLLQFLTGNPVGTKMRFQVLPYSQQIEREIKRIAKLPEPYRTLRAIALYEAMEDAKTVLECLHKYHAAAKREEVLVVDGSIKRLLAAL